MDTQLDRYIERLLGSRNRQGLMETLVIDKIAGDSVTQGDKKRLMESLAKDRHYWSLINRQGLMETRQHRLGIMEAYKYKDYWRLENTDLE